MSKSMVTIILETIAYYATNPRGRVSFSGGCRYYIEGRMCAVGRCAKNALQLQVITDAVAYSAYADLHDNVFYGDSFLKDEYRGHPKEFWQDLQNLHDDDSYWTGPALNSFGIKQVESMLKKYA